MKITGMKLDKRKYFDWMDPYDYLSRLSLPNMFALAAFEETGDGKHEPAGLLIAATEDDGISVEWLCVAPEYRFSGIGESLIIRCFDIAKTMKRERICVRIALEKEIANHMGRIETYWYERLFSEELTPSAEWRVDTRKLLNHKQLLKARMKQLKAVPLKSISPEVKKMAIATFYDAMEADKLYDVRRYAASYDETVSSVLLDGDEPCGILLLKTSDEICCPVMFYAESEQEAFALLACTAELIEAKELDMTEFYVSATEGNVFNLMDKLFPSERVDVRILAADVEDLDNLERIAAE